jgi:hypothetical protein
MNTSKDNQMKIEQLEKFCELMLSSRFELFFKRYCASGVYHEKHQDFQMALLRIFCPIGAISNQVIIQTINLERLNALCDLMLSAQFEEFYKEFVEGGQYSEKDIAFQTAVAKMFDSIMEIEISIFSKE